MENTENINNNQDNMLFNVLIDESFAFEQNSNTGTAEYIDNEEIVETFVLGQNTNVGVQNSGTTDEIDNDDEKLKNFLKSINMECIFNVLKAANITFRSLPYIKKEDLKDAVPDLGLRAEFREKLFSWKKAELGINDDTISVPSKVELWLNQNGSNTISSSNSVVGKSLNKDLKSLFNESTKGKVLVEYVKQNQQLSCEQRDDIINIIVEDIIANNTVLHTHDFERLTEEICSIFPCEKNMKDYYYILRKGKNNAGGKLYSKYRNKSLQRELLFGFEFKMY